MRVPLVHYPGMNRFVLDWLGNEAKATALLPRNEASTRPHGARSAEVAAALDASNRRWGLFAKDQLQQWAAGTTVTLVAGQQVGFAGGPLYTLAKIASLLNMKREIEAAGREATVFFWLATEDHDFEEVAQLSVPISSVSREGVNRQLDLLSIKASRSFESKAVVGRIPIPEPLITELLALYDLPRPQWLRQGITFGDSFAELIASVFGSDVILVDSLLPELRRAATPLFDHIRRDWSCLQDALRRRSGELQAAGYVPQIAPRDDGDFTLLFEIGEGGDRTIADSSRPVPPECTSTSALTRPLLQDFVLRPDVFVGGPAEVAYYAQVAPLHELTGVPMPRVALRGHALVAPKRVLRFMNRFDIAPDELFHSPDELIAGRERAKVAEVRQIAAEAERELIAKLERIAELAQPAEHSIARALSRSVGHVEYHFQKLTERAIKGLARKDRERWAAARELAATLHPDGKVQDRVVAWFPFWLRGSRHFVEQLVDEIEPDSNVFKVISI